MIAGGIGGFGLTINQVESKLLRPVSEVVSEIATKRIAILTHIRHVVAEFPWYSSSSTLPPNQKPPPPPLWAGMVRLPEAEIRATFNNTRLQQRARQLYTLGYSSSTVLSIAKPSDFIRAFGKLMAEYERAMNDGNKNRRKSALSASVSPSLAPTPTAMASTVGFAGGGNGFFSSSKSRKSQGSTHSGNSDGIPGFMSGEAIVAAGGDWADVGLDGASSPNPLSPSLTSSYGGIGSSFAVAPSAAFGMGTLLSPQDAGDYVYLDVRHIPTELDIFQCLETFCIMMAQIYSRILSIANALPNTHNTADAIMKADAPIKKIIVWIVKDIEDVVYSAIEREIEAIDPVRSSVFAH
ncbi:hypothetical protein GQ42DRAFT_164684 [Ramicandelaber brevisporus]|nr:hypothetical protein GQ42DRAFT_164684 [Ramicandelaber brevisporus]